MKIINLKILSRPTLMVALVAFVVAISVAGAQAQPGKVFGKAKDKLKEKSKDAEKESKSKPEKPSEQPKSGDNDSAKSSAGDDTEARAENAKNLAKAAGMPKPANTDAATNKLLFQAADDFRLIPRRVVVTDKDYLIIENARGGKTRRIFAVVGRTLDDGSGKCGKLMVQFDQDWKAERSDWGAVYVQNIGEITSIACGAIGK